MTKPIALIFNGVWSQRAFADTPPYREVYEPVYVHGLDRQTLAGRKAAVVPFQSNHGALAARRETLYELLARGGKLVVFGDTDGSWLDADWAERPVNNYWWKTDPDRPPVSWTDFDHPVYAGLSPRHAHWHHHGVYTRIPEGARAIQRSGEGEIISWQTDAYGGTLFVSTLDPVVEHGVQQIRHLDHYLGKLTAWLAA